MSRDQALKFFEDASKDLPKFGEKLRKPLAVCRSKMEEGDFAGFKISISEFRKIAGANSSVIKPYGYNNAYKYIVELYPDFDRYKSGTPAWNVLNCLSNANEIGVQFVDLLDYMRDETEIIDSVKDVFYSIEQIIVGENGFVNADDVIAKFLDTIDNV